ncbi:MAG: helix-turn-helix domain-containing protein [Leptonema illini]|uniref:Helix-turn-helix domain-containing protein n=1 Tax=Leptonema illini TaxID=183 RepID=A0A833H381_9LEPT|nr:MAG: helix-turn-helix domain-containing protein [Leptonema illini]
MRKRAFLIRWSLALFLVCSCLMNPLFAIDVRLNLDSEKISNQEWRPDRIDVLIDESGGLTAEDVLSKREGWQKQANPYVPGFSKSVYWVRLDLKNAGKRRRFFVENPVAYVDRIDVYVMRSGRVAEHQFNGDVLPVLDGAPQPYHPRPAFSFRLQEGESVVLLMRFASESAHFIEPIIRSRERMAEVTRTFRDFQVTYFAFLALMLVLNLAAAIRTREADFAFYSFYLVVTALYQFVYTGLFRQHLAPQSGEWMNQLLVFAGLLNFSGLTVFSLRFLRLSQNSPLWSRVIQILLGVLTLQMILVWFIPVSISDPMTHLTVLPLVLLFPGLAVWQWVKRRSDFRFFVLGWAVLFCAILTFNLFAFGIYIEPVLSRNAIQIGTAVDMIAFSLAIVDRVFAQRSDSTELNSRRGDLTKETASALERQRKRLGNVNTDKKMEELRRLMEEERLYCDEDLNLQRLAQMLELRPDQVSEMINRETGLRVNDYVNSYRIRHILRLWEERPESGLLASAFDAGFNSKSVFYQAFRKYTGVSPGEFRRKK